MFIARCSGRVRQIQEWAFQGDYYFRVSEIFGFDYSQKPPAFLVLTTLVVVTKHSCFRTVLILFVLA